MYEALIVSFLPKQKQQQQQNIVTTIFKDTNFGKLTYGQMSIIYISIQDRILLLLYIANILCLIKKCLYLLKIQ